MLYKLKECWVLVSYIGTTPTYNFLHLHIPFIDECLNIENIMLQTYWGIVSMAYCCDKDVRSR